MYTLGVRAELASVLTPPEDVGAELVKVQRGGDVTYHGRASWWATRCST
ncbi:MAG: hypothetical protein R2749_21705 [Acidimicrobiales bacterium]